MLVSLVFRAAFCYPKAMAIMSRFGRGAAQVCRGIDCHMILTTLQQPQRETPETPHRRHDSCLELRYDAYCFHIRVGTWTQLVGSLRRCLTPTYNFRSLEDHIHECSKEPNPSAAKHVAATEKHCFPPGVEKSCDFVHLLHSRT